MCGGRLDHEVSFFHTRNELGRSVWCDQQAVGYRAYGRWFRALVACNDEQCLMLLRRQTLGVGRSFAEGQKTPQLISESRDRGVLLPIKLGVALTLHNAIPFRDERSLNYIVARYMSKLRRLEGSWQRIEYRRFYEGGHTIDAYPVRRTADLNA